MHASSIQPLDAKKVENDFPSEEKTLPDIQELKSTMHEYQVKFVSSLGESEEYRRLLIKFPNLRAQIQEKYHKTRDNSSRYLGRIHALREVIAVHYQG